MTVEQHQRRTRSEILTARQGFVAGIAAGLALALVAGVLSGAAGSGLWAPVNAAGSFFLNVQPIPTGMAGAVTYVGLAVMMVVGALLGTLYATAQEPQDRHLLQLSSRIIPACPHCGQHGPAGGAWSIASPVSAGPRSSGRSIWPGANWRRCFSMMSPIAASKDGT